MSKQLRMELSPRRDMLIVYIPLRSMQRFLNVTGTQQQSARDAMVGMAMASIALTRMQRVILREVLSDFCAKEIAVKQNLTVRAVKYHLSSIYKAFDVHSRIELFRKVGRLKLEKVLEINVA
jgi:DNA-binding NarL/FixJ family response regulator